MLRALEISDLLIIDRLSMEFQPGLNVLTGETGAGKSILLDALGFVLGWRGRAELVRAGASIGEVTAVFDLGPRHAAQAVLAKAGVESDGDLILRRSVNADGRKQAWVNDRRVSADVLRALSDLLVELHGQHSDRGLLNPRNHRILLDEFAGNEAALGLCRQAWRALAAAQKALDAAEQHRASAEADEAFLRHAVRELDKLAPQPGEEASLDSQRRLMIAAERIREDVAKADTALGAGGAEGLMADALRWLDAAAARAEGRLDGALAALGRALAELGEAQQGVEAALKALSFNPSAREALEDRLFTLRGLARKHGVLADDLGQFADDLRSRLNMLDDGGRALQGLARAARDAKADYDRAASVLTKARKAAAGGLDKAMAMELAPLKMERAVFFTQVGHGDPGSDGSDAVAFVAATNPGAPEGPLEKIASGGELSRFLLALKVCLTKGSDGLTLIFDEIDRGVGGATADAVGRRLKALAEGAQVLVVTHSPQVAALGHHHWRVEKRVAAGQTLSTVTALPPEARVDEIARMVAGDTITDAARAAARALLAG